MFTGADILTELLIKLNISYVFGIPGVYILPFFDAINITGKIKVILTRHEQGAAFMADAYARVNGIGCCISTAGPGATNLLTGIAASYMDSVPIIAITAQAPQQYFGKYAIQEGTGIGRTPDICKMFAATTKSSKQILKIEDLQDDFLEAANIAIENRPGPVHLDIPSNIFLEKYIKKEICKIGKRNSILNSVNSELMNDIALEIEKAKFPIMLVGGGLDIESTQRIIDFSERTGIYIVGTLMAKGKINEHHKNYLGTIGSVGSDLANEVLHYYADLIIAMGVSFSQLSTSGWANTIIKKRIIRVDYDVNELNRNVDSIIKINNTVENVISHMLDFKRHKNADYMEKEINKIETLFSYTVESDINTVNPISLIRVINSFVTPFTKVIVDVGQNAYWAEKYIKTYGHKSFFVNGGLGSMGYGVAGAIGLYLGLEGQTRRVICIAGDGGFLMNGMEVSTAVQNNIPIIWIIFNNQALGTQKSWLKKNNLSEVACNLPSIEYSELAKSLGAEGYKVLSLESFKKTMEIAISTNKPTVIDVKIDTNNVPHFFIPDEKRGSIIND